MQKPWAAPLPLWAALLVAAGAGPILDAGFPDKDIWPLTFVGIALSLIPLIGRRLGSAFLVGLVTGLSFYFTHIQWASLFLGPVPMSALSVLESLFVGLGGMAIALAYRLIPRVWPSRLGRLGLLPIVVAGLWTAREAWMSVFPYGGFAWGRVALSQSDSPIAPLFAWVGISGVSFLMVLLVASLAEAVRNADVGRLTRAVVPVAIAAVLLVVPAWTAVAPNSSGDTMRVAAVQGNGEAGYFQGATASELLQAQVDATVPLYGEDVDVVLWPEGTTYADPLTDRYTGQVFDRISQEMDAPLVAQGITQRDGELYNTSMLWKAGEGALDLYDKKHPIPFGEYVPHREFWEPLAPDLIGLIGRDYTPGTTDTVFDVDGVIVGTNICFDIVDDQILTESIEEGAEIIFASSNNADFGRTDESAQQLAIAQIRAIELGRSVVNVSTVGISAIIHPNGTIVEQLPWFSVGTMVDDVPLATGITPAAAGGRQLEWLISGFALAALLVAGLAVRKRRG